MNAKLQEGKPTRLEVTGYAMLDEMGIDYLSQYVIGGKFCVDAFIEKSGLVIQFDGDYWHGHPIRFPNPDTRQRRRMNLDHSQDAYLKRCGFRVLRIWESDIIQSPQSMRDRIALALSEGS
jgi:very-short-patch-repair endonuclease